jgi:DNA helicase-2/ATP-dependent DNA helicase PcrA
MPDSLAEGAPRPSAGSSSAIRCGEFLAQLNAQQRLAVEHGTGSRSDDTRPLLVIAGAGSGKTNTVAHRVAYLVHHGADPQRVLLLTFSRRAAAEMERRTLQILHQGSIASRQAACLPWAGTFHGIGARLLREYAGRIGLQESFTILDRSDAEDVIAIVRHEMGLDATKERFPTKGTCLAVYSRIVNSGATPKEVLERSYPWCARWEAELKRLFAAYVEAKQAQNVLDYDDLLLYWSHMVADPSLARDIGARFDHILIDEYQDTNRLQASILLGMRPDGRGVTVVGDDAQSIYSFRAATVRNILDFPEQFSQRAHVVTLERNYRSTQAILDASNAVIGLARERFTKNLWTDRISSAKPKLIAVVDEGDQARCVADRALEQRERGTLLKSQAVLFRASSHSALLEIELTRRGIPFVKYGGLRFLEAAHIKDMLSVLRWADNPRNRVAGFRAARLVPGVGPATATRLLDALAETSDHVSVMEAFKAPASAEADWSGLLEVLRALRAPAAKWPAELEAVMRWYEPLLDRLYDDAPVRQRDLVQLLQIASTYPSRERFLTEMALDPPDVTSDEAGAPGKDDDFLILSTIHSAKGQEWHSVQILNVVDGCIPSDMSTGTSEEIEEERRLLYVAMTRAKEDLVLLMPQRFYVHQQSPRGDRHVYASRSRFIPDALVPLFERASWPAPEPSLAGTVTPKTSAPPVDIAARVRQLWR